MVRLLNLGALAATVCVLAIAGCGRSSSTALPESGAPGHTSAVATAKGVPPDTFVSLVPACGCGRHTELELFSSSSGAMLRRLAAVPVGARQVSAPAGTSAGLLFLTLTSSARCDEGKGVYMECPRFFADSCRNYVETASPARTEFAPLFTVSGTEAIGQAVPNPAGTQVAFGVAPCLPTVGGRSSLVVRDLMTGRMHVIVSSSNRCDSYGPAAWSATGTELVFPVSLAGGRPVEMAGGIGCPSGREYLATADARAGGNPAAPTQLRLIDPPRGCSFGAAGFDRIGIVATAGCDEGEPADGGDSHLGRAYLLQYSQSGMLLRRLPLKLGLEQSVIAPVPGTGDLLVTQDQPANQGYAERDWVWEFDGHHLRALASYAALDAAQILAVPW